MTIDEMKNKISMELKSPVTQQGFEVISKKLVELEKENADLKRDKENLIFVRNQNAKCMCEDKERLTKARALLKQWLQTTHAGGCDNVNLAAETEQFIAGDL